MTNDQSTNDNLLTQSLNYKSRITHFYSTFSYFRKVAADERYMQRCLELACMGAGSVSPNPLVGCVVVHNENIIGEGWHQQFGKAHAEVNALQNVADESLLAQSTLYVNLEPCSHFGKTPPCADLIISKKIKRVVVGMVDPFEKVAGNGIQKLREAGIEVSVGTLETQCKELNKRFITYVTQKRPYIILKWAQSKDGFIAPDISAMSAAEFEERRHITGFIVQKLVHRWRSEEDAIMVGTKTVLTDNPALNVRAWNGRNPVRITIDKDLHLPVSSKIFDGTQPAFIFTAKEKHALPNVEFITVDFAKNITRQITEELYKRKIQSLIVEGGHDTLQHFVSQKLWDEAQVFYTPKIISHGVVAPAISGEIVLKTQIDSSELVIYKNR